MSIEHIMLLGDRYRYKVFIDQKATLPHAVSVYVPTEQEARKVAQLRSTS